MISDLGCAKHQAVSQVCDAFPREVLAFIVVMHIKVVDGKLGVHQNRVVRAATRLYVKSRKQAEKDRDPENPDSGEPIVHAGFFCVAEESLKKGYEPRGVYQYPQ